jgi:hypothetical protein
LIATYVQAGTSWDDREEKLNEAIAGLSYDLAVLHANFVIDLGLRGQKAMDAFRRESPDVLKQVTAEWRSGRKRLALTTYGIGHQWTALRRPWERVGADLRLLLPNIPAAGKKSDPRELITSEPVLVHKRLKRGPSPMYEQAARVWEIVNSVAPDGNWRAKYDDVCDALDEAQIPFPKKWRDREPPCRYWPMSERALGVKAIEYRLELARKRDPDKRRR